MFGEIKEIRRKSKKQKSGTVINGMYFDHNVQNAIIEYNRETDQSKRSIIYQQKIAYALDKLAENLIHTNKFYYFVNDNIEYAKQQVVTFLLERLHKYDEPKGKAFSYFDRIALNFLIGQNKLKYQQLLTKKDTDITSDVDIVVLNREESINDQSITLAVTEIFIEYVDLHMTSLFDRKDHPIVESVLSLFKHRDTCEIFNKKIYYHQIKEATNTSTLQVTRVVNLMKKLFYMIYMKYKDTDFINMNVVMKIK